jgi:hypothetical protein
MSAIEQAFSDCGHIGHMTSAGKVNVFIRVARIGSRAVIRLPGRCPQCAHRDSKQ